MPVQTSYAATHAKALAGMVANSEPCVIISREVEEADGIGFGIVVQRGSGDHGCKLSTASPKYLGITVNDPGQGTEDKYPQYATAAIMTKGCIWAEASVAVAQGDAVYFVPATGVLTNVATSNQAIPNAVWDTSTSGAGLAVIRLG